MAERYSNDLEIAFGSGELVDAYSRYGLVMGSGFVSTLLNPPTTKKNLTNTSRLIDGVEVLILPKKVDSRSITLTFVIDGEYKPYETSARENYREALNQFIEMCQNDTVRIKIPSRSEDVFTLIYETHTSYNESTDGTIGSVAVKFIEPNPTIKS